MTPPNAPQQDLRDDIRDKFSARVFISLLVQLGGLKGSLAVGVAYLIGVDPFGNFALSPTDVGIGRAAPATAPSRPTHCAPARPRRRAADAGWR